MDWCLKFDGFFMNITEEDKKMRDMFDKKRGVEKKMNMNVLFLRINLNLINEVQGGISIWEEKIN